jgi:acyl carrier protein
MSLEQRVISAFAKGAMQEEANISAETKFGDIGVDSTDLLCMIFELEEEFGFEIPQVFESMKFETVGDVIEAIRQHIEENNIDISEGA